MHYSSAHQRAEMSGSHWDPEAPSVLITTNLQFSQVQLQLKALQRTLPALSDLVDELLKLA